MFQPLINLFLQYLPTILVGSVVAGLGILALKSVIRNRKNGACAGCSERSGCGCASGCKHSADPY